MSNLAAHATCRSYPLVPPPFCPKLLASLRKVRVRLQEKYERVLPGRTQLIRSAVAEAEAQAWQTQFPHLFFPDLVELRLAKIIAAGESTFVIAA